MLSSVDVPALLERARPTAGSQRVGKIAAVSLLYFGLLPVPVASAGDTPDALKSSNAPLIVVDEENQVSAKVHAASLQEVLQAFSDATGIEIIISGQANETVSADFEHLPADEAIRAILGTRSSIGFYADDEIAADDSSPRLTKVWIFKGVARQDPQKLQRRSRGLVRNTDPFDSLKRQALTDKDPDRRKRAIDALISRDDTKAKPALVQALLNDENEEVREAALDNLLWYDEETPRQALIKAALRDSSPAVRRLAIEEGFVELADEDRGARRVLIQALADKDPSIRLTVVEELADIALSDEDDKDVRQALVRALKDESEEVRLAAIEPLEDSKMKSALARAARSDPSQNVREAAQEALERLE